ncbi:MAG: TRAP transporter large permease subunit [Desulfobacterales bacterium]|jgi:tripartite ATP-independent transporter DctM subunit|nr:TRAP transporter large permease subunit [Desulfobacterales bacterium]
MTTLLVVLLLLVLIALGVDIFIALGLAGVLGILLFRGSDALTLAATAFFGQETTFELLALPLFVLMGHILAKSPIASDLYTMATRWLSWLPGGLAIASIGACTVFGAVSGVSVAGVAAIGSIAVPEMLKRGYSYKIAAGSVVSAGALAMLIPPSVPFIIYSAITGESIAKLFIGGIVPGLILAFMLSLYVLIRTIMSPELAPTGTDTGFTWKDRWGSLAKVWHTLILILLVLGSIYAGIATPTEASAIGTVGAFVVAAIAYRDIDLRRSFQILKESMRISVAIMVIIGCAMIFGSYLNMVRLPEMLSNFLIELNLHRMVLILAVQALLIVGGMFVDAASLIVITTPILLPLVKALGFDPLYYGIILVINLELAVVTPPVGLNLYTLKSCVPSLSLEEIIRSSIPFLIIQLLCLLLFTLYPPLSLWLPNMVQ